MSNPKQHHFVPQVYLRNFCFDTAKSQLYFYDKKLKICKFTHVKNVAQEKDFYSNESIENKYLYEKFFSDNVEPELGRLLDRIISSSVLSYGNAEIINVDDRKKLSNMLVYQMLRTCSARKFMREKADSVTGPFIERFLMLPQLKNNPELSKAIEPYRVLNEDRFKEIMLPEVIDPKRLERYSTILDSMLCTFYKNDTDELFITSDNPVIVKQLLSGQIGLGSAGLGQIDCIIAYPINPYLAVLLFHREFYVAHGLKKYKNRICPISQLEIVRTLNSWQRKQCSRQVYSRMPIDF